MIEAELLNYINEQTYEEVHEEEYDDTENIFKSNLDYHSITNSVGLSNSDFELQMMYWDKEDRNYAFIDSYWDDN